MTPNDATNGYRSLGEEQCTKSSKRLRRSASIVESLIAKFVPSVEGVSINWCFAGTCDRKPMDSSPAVLSANVSGGALKIPAYPSGSRKTSAPPEHRRKDKMTVFTSLIHYMKLRRVQIKQKRQKRIVLRMLASSGVVRPGHIELHYTKQFARPTARRA